MLHYQGPIYFNPRSPRGERPKPQAAFCAQINFNPRSPRGERRSFCISAIARDRFQSTLPSRGATARYSFCDLILQNFNPRSPRGERHALINRIGRTYVFQSTLPSRGATPHRCKKRKHSCYFNPRSPRGERLLKEVGGRRRSFISIHAPLAGSDG